MTAASGWSDTEMERTDFILHAEELFAVCCKPVGVECEQMLPQQLAQALGGRAEDFYCVHRLDRAVGGVMVYARSAKAAAALSQQIADRRFQKRYLAVCAGAVEPSEGQMRDFLYKDHEKGRAFPVRSVRRGVKEALLTYETLALSDYGGGCSLVSVLLDTGRFHQIRCQFASRRHPLLGDGKYGSREKGCTVALWCRRLTLLHPKTGREMCFSADPPQDFPWSLFTPMP